MADHYANDHQEGKRQDANEWQGRDDKCVVVYAGYIQP